MLLDLIFALVIIMAIFKGYKRGLIAGAFSLVAIIIGLAAALKLSAVVAVYIGKALKISDQWLPIISFAVVFLIIVLLIRFVAKLIEKAVELVLLGWLNKLGGIFLYIVIYTIIFSVLIFYAEQINLLKPDLIKHSATYSFVQPWGPKVIDGIGSVIPVFKGMFKELENFFEGVSREISVK